MQVDIEHVLFWMDAIRNSTDSQRTLESFWKGQIRSKIWLIENLRPFVKENSSVDICGGWNGVLASLLFQSNMNVDKIRSIDIDIECQDIANTVNKIEEMQGRFIAVTSDMCDLYYDSDIVINTSCEHIDQLQYNRWLDNISDKSLLVLQSNNYHELDEHIRTSVNLKDFESQSMIKVIWSGELELPKYKRFMIIGKKNV